jgi:hypothetical protein
VKQLCKERSTQFSLILKTALQRVNLLDGTARLCIAELPQTGITVLFLRGVLTPYELRLVRISANANLTAQAFGPFSIDSAAIPRTLPHLS